MNKKLKLFFKILLVTFLLIAWGFILFYGWAIVRYIHKSEESIQENTEFVSTGLRKFKDNTDSFTTLAESIKNSEYDCVFNAPSTPMKNCFDAQKNSELAKKMTSLEITLIKKKWDYIFVYTRYDLDNTFYLYDKNTIDNQNMDKYVFWKSHPIGKENEHWLRMKE